MAQRNDPTTYRELLRFPDDVPDISVLHPPGGNSQPEGIEQSYFARRKEGSLPEIY